MRKELLRKRNCNYSFLERMLWVYGQKMHTIRSSNIVQGSQGMTRKKRSPPHLLRCQVWQSTGASTDVTVNTNTRIHMHKETRGTALKHRRKKKNDDGYRGGFPATYVSQTQRAGHTHMRGNMRLNIAPNRFYGQTEKKHTSAQRQT